jgi:hypothetical protein
MQLPGSIFGLSGTKMFCRPLPITTVGVRGVARLTQMAGVAAIAQFGVMQTCASAGAPTAKATAATTRPEMHLYARSMGFSLKIG